MRKAGSFRLRSETKLAPEIRRVIRERFIPHGFIYGCSDLVDAPGDPGEAPGKGWFGKMNSLRWGRTWIKVGPEGRVGSSVDRLRDWTKRN